jgi:hypothetical protein
MRTTRWRRDPSSVWPVKSRLLAAVRLGTTILGIRNILIVCRRRFDAVTRMCANLPRAAHYFATYLDNSRLIKLHFEHLHCDGLSSFCTGESCLRQEYVSARGHYRFMRNYYGRNND